ncbi:hypothetical protein MPSEU_000827800 [Mayamaea pseudoterrestris]|nr:hypothetical protein MPSEU_000827800 [Mayamaea pseudoterrestris]
MSEDEATEAVNVDDSKQVATSVEDAVEATAVELEQNRKHKKKKHQPSMNVQVTVVSGNEDLIGEENDGVAAAMGKDEHDETTTLNAANVKDDCEPGSDILQSQVTDNVPDMKESPAAELEATVEEEAFVESNIAAAEEEKTIASPLSTTENVALEQGNAGMGHDDYGDKDEAEHIANANDSTEEEAIEQTEESFSQLDAASPSTKKKLLGRWSFKQQKNKPQTAAVYEDTVRHDEAAHVENVVANVEQSTDAANDDAAAVVKENNDEGLTEIPPDIPKDLSAELGDLNIDEDFDLDASVMVQGDGVKMEHAAAASRSSSTSSTNSVEPCTRPEIYSVHYKPSPAEQAAIIDLELQIGVTEQKSWKIFAKPRVHESIKQNWRNLAHAGKSFATSSILLKQDPVELMVAMTGSEMERAVDTSSAPTQAEDAVEVAEHGTVLVTHVESSITNMSDNESSTNIPMQLYLLTHGFALATKSCASAVLDASTNNAVYTLHQVVEWKQIHHVTPLLALNALQIHLRQPLATGSSSLILIVPEMQWQSWLDAFHTVLVQNTLHSSRPHTDIGWQYALVQVPWFTLAICGAEDEGIVRNRDLLNHLDVYNQYAPLHYAIRRGNTAAVKLLLEAGANANLLGGDDRQSPMSMAQDVEDDDIVQLLLEFGAKREARKDKTELFGRVAATEDTIKEKKEAKALEVERAAEVERIKTERVQAQMAENMRLMQQRGEEINEMSDKATVMNEGASEYGSLAKQLKEKAKQQAQPFSMPAFSNPFKRGKGGNHPPDIEKCGKHRSGSRWLPIFHKWRKLCEWNLPTPKLVDGSVADYFETEQRIILDGYVKELTVPDIYIDPSAVRRKRILVFLYGRRFFENDKNQRMASIAMLLDKSKQSGERLTVNHLIFTGCQDDYQQTIQMKCWIDHAQNYGKSDEHCVNIFHDSTIRIVRGIERFACAYLHACAVVQCYKVQQSRPDRLCRMVDLAQYIRQHFDSEELHDLILESKINRCHLERLLADPKVVTYTLIDMKPTSNKDHYDVREQLKTHGPGLISHLVMDKRMNEYKQPLLGSLTGDYELPSFIDLNSVPAKGRRVWMVLVAMRKCEDEWRVLCQYWTDKMQFVELSFEYLRASDVLITFIEKPQMGLTSMRRTKALLHHPVQAKQRLTVPCKYCPLND